MQTVVQYLNYLGLRVRDRVTQFTGVVESISFDLYGCVQAVVRPAVEHDDKGSSVVPEARWFDVKRLDVLSSVPVMPSPNWRLTAIGEENGPAEKPSTSNVAR
jgi:hypothetical protein